MTRQIKYILVGAIAGQIAFMYKNGQIKITL